LFVSCRKADAIHAERFRDAVNRRFGARFEIVMHDGEADPDEWRDECEALIRRSEGVVCLIGDSISDSAGVPWEAEMALALHKPVVIISIADQSPELPRSMQEAGLSIAVGNAEEGAAQLDKLLMDAALFNYQSQPPTGDEVALLEQYRLILESAESLQTRRQTLHTFFLSINSLFIGGVGLLGKESLDHDPGLAWAIVGISVFGFFLCGSWRRQIRAYGAVNTSKYDVIQRIEARLPAAPFLAEWIALVQRDFQSFTEAESRIPTVFRWIYLLAAIGGIALFIAGVA
jgi:hypothetical protein